MNRFSNWLAALVVTAGLLSPAAAAPAYAATYAPANANAPGPAVTLAYRPTLTPPAYAAASAPASASAPGPAVTLAYRPTLAPPPAAEKPSPAPAAGPAQEVLAAPANPTPAPAPVHKDKLIFIDPGHGASDPGAVHMNGNEADLLEKDVNLAIAVRLADLLRQDGYDVQMSRSSDTKPSGGQSQVNDLQKRVDMANDAGADLLISIHNNARVDRSVRGTEVWYCADRPFSGDNERLAKAAQEALVRNLNQAGYATVDRGIKNDALMGHFAISGSHIARPSQMPSIIGETLYMTNDQDAAQLRRPEMQTAIARGYLEGIKAYFGDTK